MLRQELEDLRQNKQQFEHLKTRHGNMCQETCDLKDEVANLRKKHDRELETLKNQIRDLREQGDQASLRIMIMTTEKDTAIVKAKEL